MDNYQDNLARILVDQIAKQNNVSDAKELENIGFFSVDEIFPDRNFLVDETGITYSFNEYEIAALRGRRHERPSPLQGNPLFAAG